MTWNLEEVEIENQRIDLMKVYLPQMLSEEELTKIVKEKLEILWMDDPRKERGKLIWAVMQDYKAVVDWKMLNDIINTL